MDIAEIVDLTKSEGFRLILLWMIWAQLLFGGMMVGTPDSQRTRRMPAWTRMTSSMILVGAAASWWYFAWDTPLHQYASWLVIGMTLGFIGDLFMANLLKVRGVDHVLLGMLSFGLGHIAYIAGLLDVSNRLTLDDDQIIVASFVVWWIIAVVLWYLLIFRPTKEQTILHLAALPYAILLASTTALACAIALDHPEFVLVALGTILFLTSDLILAMRLFNNAYFPLIDDVVWLTYGPGQMLIVYGIAFFGLGFSVPILGV